MSFSELNQHETMTTI